MARHSKNNTAHSIFTYWERKKMRDAGTMRARLGQENLRQFEQCWLCLSTAQNPVCTPNGFVYCRSCIVMNFGEQKQAQQEQRRAYEAYMAARAAEEESAKAFEEEKKLRQFAEAEGGASITSSTVPPQDAEDDLSAPSAADKSSSRRQKRDRSSDGGVMRSLPEVKAAVVEVKDRAESRRKNFWIPENTPTSGSTAPPEPKASLVCPVSEVPLKLKELITLNPTMIAEAANASANNSGDAMKWMCPLSRKVIGHQKAVAVRQTGQVLLAECAKKFIIGERIHPEDPSDKTVFAEHDLVELQAGGTGFSAHNEVEATKYRPVME